MAEEELRWKIESIVNGSLALHSVRGGRCVYLRIYSGIAVADRILALGLVELNPDQRLPAFARVDVEGKPEVGRFYDGYLAGQEDMREAGFRKVKQT